MGYLAYYAVYWESHSCFRRGGDHAYSAIFFETQCFFDDRVAGALLQSARLRSGLSQTAFADLIGVAQPTLSAYESGRRQPTLPTLMRLLARAGFDLRLEVVEHDDHDDVLAEWEASLDDTGRERLRRQGYRLVSDVA